MRLKHKYTRCILEKKAEKGTSKTVPLAFVFIFLLMVGGTGIEPVTSAMSTQHSNQLS
jgi:hypothetical protein